MNVSLGKVYLVGAGPGDPGLVTLRARELIRRAEVLVYDQLANPGLLGWAPDAAEKIDAGKSAGAHTLTQDEINALLVARARTGRSVVRLKGGDPYLFGRGGEEAEALAAAGIPFEVVPGVTSALAAPAYAGIPVTHRDHASLVTFITGHEDPTKPGPAVDWNQIAALPGTKVILMGMTRLRAIAGSLLAGGMKPETPVALVRRGTTPRQETLEGTLADIADRAEAGGFGAPAVIVVGEVATLGRRLNWYDALPLRGRRVVVTRPRRQAGELSRRLCELGADVLEIPAIRIVPLPLEPELEEKLRRLSDHFDWLVFTSPNAVENFFTQFFRRHADLRELGPIKIAALGPATAAGLARLRLRVDFQPDFATRDRLLETFPACVRPGERLCLPQSRLAGRELADGFRAAGAAAEIWPLYDTVPEREDPTGARRRFLEEGAHWIVFASASAAENWHRLGLAPVAGAPRPRTLSMGPATSARLNDLQIRIDAEAPEPSLESVIATLCEKEIEFHHAHD